MLRRILIAGAAMGAGALAWGSLVERNWFALRRHRIPCLPPGAPPLRLLHVSDLHLRAHQHRKCAFLQSLAGIEPDLAIGTGDFIGDDQSPEAVAEALGAIRPRLGALFVLGSNDHFQSQPKNPFRYFRAHRPAGTGVPNGSWPEMVRLLEKAGWRMLDNETITVDGIDVVGLGDPHIRRADLGVASPRSGSGFRLAVVHSPDVAPDLARLGYDLILCGHTHGGQVRVPGVGALVNNSALPRRYARGVFRLEEGRETQGGWLHINAGLGTSRYAPVRFACRPEACVLELTHARPA